MGIRVTTIRAGVPNEYGQALPAGTTFTPINDDYALSLISQKLATDTDDFLGEAVNAPFIDVPGPAGLSADGQNLVRPDGSVIPLTPPSHTWAGKPTPAASGAGTIIRVTDVGVTDFGSLWVSDGAIWSPLGGNLALYANSVPVGIAQSGTVAANGTITFATALPGNYPNGIWLYFPAGAINTPAGGAAFYYCTSVAASTTNFQVTTASPVTAPFNVPPTVPTGFANAVGSAGAYTGATTEISALSYTVKADLLGLYRGLTYQERVSVNNNADAKTVRTKFGGATLYSVSAASVTGTGVLATVSNRGSAGQQLFSNGAADSAFNSSSGYTAQDTTTAQNLLVTLQNGVAANNLILESLFIDMRG